MWPQLLSKQGGALADGTDDPQGDIPSAGPLGQQADNLAFRKDCAHTGDIHRRATLHKLVDIVQRAIQNAAHHLHKAAGACGAFIVHDKIRYAAVPIQQNGLTVLAADIHHAANARAQRGRSLGVTGDFGDSPVGLFQQIPAVAGGHHKAHLVAVHGVVNLLHPLPGPGGGGQQGGFHHLFSVVQGAFCGGGATVDS